MSNNISNKQLNTSLAGQIALNLDKKDGADGQISQSVWNGYWEENNAEAYKGQKENVGQEGISVQDAFKLIMTRIFNAAKKQLSKTEDKSWDNEQDKYNTIDNVAKDWFKKAGGEKLKATQKQEINTPKAQEAQAKIAEQNFSEINKTNLDKAFNELKTMSGLFEEKYKIPQQDFLQKMSEIFKSDTETMPIDKEIKTADFAVSLLSQVFQELMPNAKKADNLKNAFIEVAEHYKNIEGENIWGKSCAELASDHNKIEELTNSYLREINKDNIISSAEKAINNIKNNFDTMSFPKEVNREAFKAKLDSYNIEENLERLQQHYRFCLSADPSEADITTAIISDILGMNGDKANREIKSEITLRQIAVENTMKMYDDNMTLNGVTFKEIKTRYEAHKAAVEKAVVYITKNIDSTKISQQFETQEDKQMFLNCLKNVGYDIESRGAGRAEDGVFVIETNNEEVKNNTEMLVLLLHETYHNYSELKGRNHKQGEKTEEAAAEMFALLSASDIIDQYPEDEFPKISHFKDGKNVQDYKTKDDVINDTAFVQWLEGYNNTHSGNPKDCAQEAKDVILIK